MFQKLDFKTSNLLDPTRGARQALGQVGGLLSEYQAEQTAKEARTDKLLASAVEQSFRDKQLAQQKDLAEKKMAATAAARAASRSDTAKNRAAQMAADDAYMQAMGTPDKVMKDVITEEAARGAVTADPKILADLETKDPSLTPFMRGGEVPAETIPAEGLLADVVGGVPTSEQDVASYLHDISGRTDMDLLPMGEQALPEYGGQPRGAMFKAPVDVPVEAPVTPTPTPIVSTGEEAATQASIAGILGAGAGDVAAQEAGIVTQKEVDAPATTDSMIKSLSKAYKEAKDPRAKNAIARKVFSLQSTQAAIAAENKKYTARLGEIKYKQQMEGKYNPKFDTTVTSKANQKLIDDTLVSMGIKEGDLSGAITGFFADHGMADKATINTYIAKARLAKNTDGTPVSDAQIAAAMQNVKRHNLVFDDTLTQSAEQFVNTAIAMPKTSVKTKY